MKKILTILLFFVSAVSIAQTVQKNTKDSTITVPSNYPGAVFYVQGVMYGDTLVIKERDTSWTPLRTGTVTIFQGSLYEWNGTYWVILTGGSGALQFLTAGLGLIGNPYNGSTPQTYELDTAFINQYIINPIVGADTSIILVDSIICVSSAALEGVDYLVCPSPVGGDTLAAHANQIVTRTGGVLNYQTPVTGDQLVTANPVVYYIYTGTYPTGVWVLQHRVVQATYTNYGGNLNIGTSNIKAVNIGVRNHTIATFNTDSSLSMLKFKKPSISSNNYAKWDTATGKLTYDTFKELVAGNGITITSSATADTISSTSSGTGKVYTTNGLSNVDDSTVELGGTLTHNTDIQTGVYTLTAQSNAAAIPLQTSSNGNLAFSSTTQGGAYSAGFISVPGVSNTVAPILKLSNTGTGTVGANNIGASVDFNLQSTTTTQLSNQLISKFTDATNATRTSEFSLTGINAGTTQTQFTLAGSGQAYFNQYGVGSFTTGTPAYVLGVTSAGKVIETSVGTAATIVDSIVLPFTGLRSDTTFDLTRPSSGFKNIEIQAEDGRAAGFKQEYNDTQAILEWQVAVKGTYKFYIVYTYGFNFLLVIALIPVLLFKKKRTRYFNQFA